MSRPSKLIIQAYALLHNLEKIKHYAPEKGIIAMIKANAYGTTVKHIAPLLEGQVEAFGLTCLEEALHIRALGMRTPCVLFQGVFESQELEAAVVNRCAVVLHHQQQLEWLIHRPLSQPITLWVKVNTGMNRLGFNASDIPEVMHTLQQCPWVDKDIGLMSHLACSDEPNHPENHKQIELFNSLPFQGFTKRSLANSGAIIALPKAHADVVRPGIMLYGISPFAGKTGLDLGLKPVMRFVSAITSIKSLPPFAKVGYQGTWFSEKPARLGIVAIGYGDGYPRRVQPNTKVWVKGEEAPIVGRISMDNLAIDITDFPNIGMGDEVELWGEHIPIEHIAQSAGTIAYELLCQVSKSVRLPAV